MVHSEDVRKHCARLEEEVRQRANHWSYGVDVGMEAGVGLTIYDCGLVIASIGQLLGYHVRGKAEWRRIILPGQMNAVVSGPEERIPYLHHVRSTADYTWFDSAGRCVAVFETDGRDNSPDRHLPEREPVRIREHNSTNNLFKLSKAVLQKRFGYVPRLRAWVLFRVDKERAGFSAKGSWRYDIVRWKTLFSRCGELDDAIVMRDTDLFSDQFIEQIMLARS